MNQSGSKRMKPDSLLCVIVGAGGHARVLIESLRISDSKVTVVATDRDTTLHGETLDGVEIIGGDSELKELGRSKAFFSVGVGSTGDAGLRRELFLMATELGLVPMTVRHPSAIVAERATLAPGCQLMAGAIVSAGVALGENVIVNTAAVIEHDSVVGDHAHIAPRATIGGGAQVEPSAHIGIGATVLQNVTVGAGAIVGAGAVVIGDVQPGSTVVGNPSRKIPTENA